MTRSNYPRRGDIHWTELDPARGSEMQKTRPCLVVTADAVNQRRRTVVIIPLSTTSPKAFPIYVPLPSVSPNSQAVVDQIRVVDRYRLGNFLATATADEMQNIAAAMKIVLDIS